MRLPYLQLAEKFVTVQSKMVARLLRIKRSDAIGMGALLFETALEMTSTDTSPPTGVIDGVDAAEILEAGMEWDGEPGKAFGAFVRAGVIATMETGARVRGMDRYRDAWEKQARARAAGKAGAQARWGAASCASSVATAPESDSNRTATADAPHGNRSAQTETETETDKKLLPAASAILSPSVLKPTQAAAVEHFVSIAPDPDEAERQLKGDVDGTFPPTGLGFIGWWQRYRELHGMTRESLNVSEEAQWADRCIAEVGPDRLFYAAASFFEDEFWREAGWPLSIFRGDKVWRVRANDPGPPRTSRRAWS